MSLFLFPSLILFSLLVFFLFFISVFPCGTLPSFLHSLYYRVFLPLSTSICLFSHTSINKLRFFFFLSFILLSCSLGRPHEEKSRPCSETERDPQTTDGRNLAGFSGSSPAYRTQQSAPLSPVEEVQRIRVRPTERKHEWFFFFFLCTCSIIILERLHFCKCQKTKGQNYLRRQKICRPT